MKKEIYIFEGKLTEDLYGTKLKRNTSIIKGGTK